MKVVAVNGSPRMEKGATHKILDPFLEGLKKGGGSVELFHLQKMKIRPCLGELKCWLQTPGECFYKDDMTDIYESLRAADVLVIATPVYVPLPGVMQDFLNRIVPLLQPALVLRDGRTRAKMRDDVNLSKFFLVSTGGWWELENFNRTLLIVEELAETSSVEFAGSLLRPHARMMRDMTDKAEESMNAAKEAGYQFATNGKVSPEISQVISQPLISKEEYWKQRQ